MRLPGSLWREPDFLKLWVGDTISSLGSAVTGLALPITAVTLLAATPIQMGVLGAARNAPFIVFGLLAGVVVDRFRRRPVLVLTSVGEALALVSIPLAASFGALAIDQLYVVAFVAGSFSLVAVVANQAFLPILVGRARLIEGNAKFRMVGSVTHVAGPGIAGVLIQVLTAPIAIVLDALSFLIEAALMVLVRTREPAPPLRPAGRRIWYDVEEGLRYVLGQPVLRSIMLSGATHNLFSNGMLVALYVLYATRTLGLEPVQVGLVFAAAGPGALLGSAVAQRVSERIGLGRALLQMQILTGVARSLVPLAALVAFPLAFLVAGEFLLGIASAIFNVNQLSLRQSMTPDHLQGRMNASIRFLMWSITPLGAIAGGVLAERVGMLETLTLAAVGTTAAALWLASSLGVKATAETATA